MNLTSDLKDPASNLSDKELVSHIEANFRLTGALRMLLSRFAATPDSSVIHATGVAGCPQCGAKLNYEVDIDTDDI